MRTILSLVILLISSFAHSVRAEVSPLVTGYQYGLTYLPLMIMQEQNLIEKEALKQNLGDVKTEWKVFSGPAPINDGVLTGNLHFGAVGTSSLVTLWAKTKGKLNVKAVGSLSCMPMYLNTNRPNIKGLEDFSSLDKIALPSVKVGVQAVTLQMAAAQKFGTSQANKMDALTVGMAHPEAYIALLAQPPGIAAHFASVPFQSQELEDGKGRIHTVLKSYDVLGGPASFTLVVASERFRIQNPKSYAAYVAAFEEATQFIKSHPEEAARIYLKITGSKENLTTLVSLIKNPEHIFDLTPRQIAKYANFMNDVGTIKERPSSWQDMVHPNLLQKAGS